MHIDAMTHLHFITLKISLLFHSGHITLMIIIYPSSDYNSYSQHMCRYIHIHDVAKLYLSSTVQCLTLSSLYDMNNLSTTDSPLLPRSGYCQLWRRCHRGTPLPGVRWKRLQMTRRTQHCTT